MLTLEEVEHIAALARLELAPDEKQRFQRQLSEILEYAARLQQVDTSMISPTSSVLKPRSVLRPDTPEPGLKTDELLQNAPSAESGQFRVPPVLSVE